LSVEGCRKVQEDTSAAIGRKFLLEIADSNQKSSSPRNAFEVEELRWLNVG